MPRAKQLIAGLEILLRYESKGWCDAENGIVWGPKGVIDTSMPDEDKLLDFGWRWDEGRQRWYAST